MTAETHQSEAAKAGPTVERLVSDRLSTFRTEHEFERYAEFETVEQFKELCAVAEREGRELLVLGNGSNVLFTRRRVKTLVAKNKLERVFEDLGGGRVRASSSLMISVILKHCRANGLDSFYYLASVPATVGGAVAMNAGRGRHIGASIFDFIETVTWFENGEVRTADVADIPHEYRWTRFTGMTGMLVLEATFRFPPTEDNDDKIQERVRFSKEVQDHSLPNCGSVFKESRGGLMLRLRGLKIGNSSYSKKTANWLLNDGPSPRGLVWLIRVAKLAHKLLRSKCAVELIEVD